MNSKFEKIGELLGNETVVKELTGKSLEETLNILLANGVAVTAEELHAFYNFVTNTQVELNEEDLDNVAGGSLKSWWQGVKATAKGLWDGFWGI